MKARQVNDVQGESVDQLLRLWFVELVLRSEIIKPRINADDANQNWIRF